MDLKRLITHFTYRIEEKPEGGFVAHASDPTVPPLEAATREELQQKIQANIANALAAEFPGLKVPPGRSEKRFAFHIEQKPSGGFSLHSSDPDSPPIEGSSHDEIESPFAEKLIGFVGKHLSPEFSQLLGQAGSADVKVFVNKATKTLSVKSGSRELHFTGTGGGLQPVSPQSPPANDSVSATDAAAQSGFAAMANTPITPEETGGGRIFLYLLGLLLVGGILYFFFLSR